MELSMILYLQSNILMVSPLKNRKVLTISWSWVIKEELDNLLTKSWKANMIVSKGSLLLELSIETIIFLSQPNRLILNLDFQLRLTNGEQSKQSTRLKICLKPNKWGECIWSLTRIMILESKKKDLITGLLIQLIFGSVKLRKILSITKWGR